MKSNQYHFKRRFEEFDYSEEIPVDNSVKNFTPISLDIGWQLVKLNKKNRKKTNDKYIKKGCLGTVSCRNTGVESGEPCPLYGIEVRPASTRDKIKEQKCVDCKEPLFHDSCDVVATFTLKKRYDINTAVTSTTCSVETTGIHLHDKVVAKHLTPDEKEELAKRVINEPTKTPSKFMNGTQSCTGKLDKPLYEINPILSNLNRVKYELRKVCKELGIDKSPDFLGQLGKLQTAFDKHIVFSQVSLESEFIIVFTSPTLRKEQLRFDKFPIVTDVTYKAVATDKNKYLCSSVIYVHGLNKSIVIFQAVIGGLDAKHFAIYFIKLFTVFKINKHQFLGMVMDFSAAQRLGFLHAFNFYFNNSADGTGTREQMNEGLSFLKGCYMHWMQSVQRMINNYAAVPNGASDDFKTLVHGLRTTESSATFMDCVIKLVGKYPGCRRWLKWWLQPSVATLIFKFNSMMKPELMAHKTRTANSVEAFHSRIYSIISHQDSLGSSLTQLLRLSSTDSVILGNYIDLGIKDSYGHKKRYRPSKTIGNFYKKSDSRPPDNTEALLGDENSQVVKSDKKKEEDNMNYFKDLEESSNERKRKRDPIDCDSLEGVEGVEGVEGDVDDFSELDELKLVPESTTDFMTDKPEATEMDILEELPSQIRKILENDDSVVEEKKEVVDLEVEGKEIIDLDAKEESSGSVENESTYEDPDPELLLALKIVKDSRADKLMQPVNYSEATQPSMLRLKGNKYNSCWIDAPIEMMCRSVLPELVEEMKEIDDTWNIPEHVLVTLFYRYFVENDPIKGNELARTYFWSNMTSFRKGSMEDLSIAFPQWIDSFLPQIRSMFAFKDVKRYHGCSQPECKESRSVEDVSISSVIFASNLPTMKQYVDLGNQPNSKEKRERLAKQFAEKFTKQFLFDYRVHSCTLCKNNTFSSINYIPSDAFPPFLFIIDGTNFLGATGPNAEIYFPWILTLGNFKYILHARIYSTAATGIHFYTVAKIKTSVSTYAVYKFDNDDGEKPRGEHKEDLDSLEEKSLELSKSKNTVIVCYKKL